MVNAWSLLYDELYGDDEMSETKYWYDMIVILLMIGVMMGLV